MYFPGKKGGNDKEKIDLPQYALERIAYTYNY
jgi:hypothetical protein